MRTVTGPTSVQMQQKLGTEPIIIVQINWASGTEYYGYKTDTVGSWSVQGKILDFSSIASQGKQDNTGEVSSVSLTLDDSDGSLKLKVDREVIEGASATVYHWFEGLSQSDALVILKGKIAGDIVWSEGQRTLSFDIESYVEDRIIGYAPEEGDFANLWSEAIGIPWPLAFGTVLKSKCVRIKNRPVGKLIYGINQNFSFFQVENGSEFPQGTPVDIEIGQIRYTGTFADDLFTVTTANNAYYTNLDFQDRLFNDEHYNDARVAWLAPASTVNLKGLYCIVNHPIYGWMVNKCIGQEGQKCFFLKPWRPSDTTLEVKLNSAHVITEAAPIPRSSWAATYTIESLAFWYETLTTQKHTSVSAVSVVIKGIWSIRSGVTVNQVVGYDNSYVANLIPSTEILEVYAYRNYQGEKIFAPVPSSYYTVNLSETLGTQTATTINFPTALEDYIGEEWESDLYVSLRSSVGPNAANIIKWLLETYSSLSVDTASFSSVASKLDRYPANFTVFDRPDVLDICEDIAWQTRCVLYIKNNTVYIIYLSEVPTPDATIDEEQVLLKSISLSFSTTEDIYTRINAKWRKDYSEEEGVEKEWAYSNNINIYGLSELDKDFFIYNIESLVQLSAAFWGYRYSNSWRRISLTVFLEQLELEIFDVPSYDLDVLSDNAIRGVLDLVNHDAVDNQIALSSELASKAADVDGANEPVEDLNYFTGDPSYTINGNPMPGDVGAGRQEIDYEVPTQGQTDSDPDSDTGGTGTGDPDEYYLEFTSEPTEVQRGVNFDLAVRIKDTLGNTIYESTSATLSFTDSDSDGDVLNTTTISIVNGTWSSSAMQITGGSGSDIGTISVAAGGYISDTTEPFDIIAARVDTLVWGSIPASVTREAAIAAYTLSGGAVGEVIDIVLNSTDPADKLYDSTDTEITQITLGAGGSYTFTNTYIAGGQSGDSATLTARDTVQQKYVEKQSSQFTIAGLSNVSVTTTITFGQSASSNGDYLDMTPPASIRNNVSFTLIVEIKNPDGTRDTSYNEVIRLDAFNDDTDDRLIWLDAGPNAGNYGDYILADLANGIWEYTSTKLNVEGVDNVRLEAEVLYKEADFNDVEVVPVSEPYFGLIAPSQITRGVSFNLDIQAYDGDGSPLTSYVPSGNVDFTLTGSGLNGEIISPTYTDNSGWSNGGKTVSVTISGGSGNKVITINVED